MFKCILIEFYLNINTLSSKISFQRNHFKSNLGIHFCFMKLSNAGTSKPFILMGDKMLGFKGIEKFLMYFSNYFEEDIMSLRGGNHSFTPKIGHTCSFPNFLKHVTDTYLRSTNNASYSLSMNRMHSKYSSSQPRSLR